MTSSIRTGTTRAVHAIARRGFDASGASGLYDRARPSYPLEVLSHLLAAPGAHAPLKIAELGAGTGIATRLLLKKASDHGGIARYVATDPSDGMLTHLRRTLFGFDGSGLLAALRADDIITDNADIRISSGAFDTFEAGHDNDLVVVAQAWHWCPDFNAALTHIAGSLRPGGVLALIWNLEDRDAAPWVARLRDIYEVYESGTPQYRLMQWHAMYETCAYHTYFDALTPMHVKHELPTTVDGVIERVLSKSYISVQNEATRSTLVERVRALFTEDHSKLGLRWLDKSKGIFAYPYGTGVFLET